MRNFGVEAAEAIARRTAEARHPYVVGFNLAGDEAGFPARDFAGRSRSPPRPASAAPSTPASTPAPSRSARRSTLPVTRIGHGVRAIEDPALVAELAERGIVLEVLPDLQRRPGRLPELRNAPAARACAAPV